MRGGIIRKILAAVTAAFMLAGSVNVYASGQSPSFTPEEEAFIASRKSVRIGFVADRIPVSFADENGDLAGISRYIFDRVSELSGINFEYVALPEGEITYDYLLDGGFDLVSSVEYNKENQNANGILISEPYLRSKKVVVAKEGIDFRFDANLSIAILTGSQTIRKVLGASYPNFELVDYPSIEACFNAVNSGEADLMMQNQYVVEHFITKPIYERLQVIPVLGLDDELCFSAVVAFGGGEGTPPEEGEKLIGILNKCIDCMSEDEIGSYTISGITENQYRYSFSDFMYRYRMAVRVFIISAAVIVILVVLLLRLHVKYTENRADEKIKKRFLSTMSHEIRTPLNGLIGLNYLMSQNTDKPERVRKYLKQSNVTANYLLSLVNDMLDMSRLQSNSVELAEKPVDLRLVTETVESIAENALSAKGLHFDTDIDLDYPCVIGDGIRIQQVMLHLLDNAGKFTPRGGKVSLKIRQQEASGGKIVTTATVSDTGRGMSEEFQKKIFDTFSQELDTVSKGNQGTGLGLSISRKLALLMGGDLKFVSQKGEGSVFTFTFLAEPGELTEEESHEAHPDGRPRPRILVAEDNELNAEIILELLRENGFEAELAENGKAALEKFERSTIGYYGVILMDLLMPEMNGFEAARAIRDTGREDSGSVRIFACSANSSEEDRANAEDSGMNGFVTKPVDVERLLEMIEG